MEDYITMFGVTIGSISNGYSCPRTWHIDSTNKFKSTVDSHTYRQRIANKMAQPGNKLSRVRMMPACVCT